MAATYSPSSLGIKAPSGGFQQGGWYSGRQYWGGTLSDPGVIHPQSDQRGAGQLVSPEVNAQSAAKQNVSSAQLEAYLQAERDKQAAANPQPAGGATPSLSDFGGGGGGGGGGVGSVAGLTAPGASINLPEMYKSLYNDSGIQTLKDTASTKEKAYNDAVSKINDNPYYSEATRVGRLAKLETNYRNDTQSIKDDIATRTADIETKMNLQTKQFDINSQQAKDALTQFNTLLGLGALDNASGEDIAAITRTTGLSSNMISGAINANKAKNVQTSTIQYDDGTNQGFAVINSKTGQIISKQVVAASKPSTKTTGSSSGSGSTGGTKNTQTSDAQYLVTLYGNVNKGNPSWQKAHDLRSQYSPNDFYNMLLVTYPLAASYIKSIKGSIVK